MGLPTKKLVNKKLYITMELNKKLNITMKAKNKKSLTEQWAYFSH